MNHVDSLKPSLIRGLVIALLSATPSFAQAPAPAPAPAPPPPTVEASAQFTYLNTTGNSPTRSLGTGGDVTWRPGIWTHRAKAAFAQNQDDDVVTARSLTGLFRSAREINPKLSGYAQYDYLHDVFAGITQRHIFEAGVSYKALERPRQKLRADAALGYLNEQHTDADSLVSPTLTLGAMYHLDVSKTAVFEYEPRYLLTLADNDAWKYEQIAALGVSINSIFSLKASHTIRYSADPPAGFERTDMITSVSLVAKIKRP